MITSHRDARRDADVWLKGKRDEKGKEEEEANSDSRSLVYGVAYSGSGRSIASVEVRVGGEDEEWKPARLLDHNGGVVDGNGDNEDEGNRFAWTRWEALVEVPGGGEATTGAETVRLCCRAVDCEGNSQPASPAEAVKKETSGYLYNACHCVDVRLEELSATL